MPRHVDQDVHAAFVEFRAGQDDKCMSVQCIYCQQVRAKNTTRQKQHLLQCAPYLQAHPEVALQASAASASAAAAAAATASATAATAVPAPTPSAHPAHAAGPGAPNATPIPPPAVHPVPSYGQDDVAGDHTTLSFMPNPRINGSPSQGRPSLGGDGTPAPKKQKTKATPGSNLPEIPLREVHAAFVEFRAKEDDKCMSVRCIYCNQTVLKDKIPANNLRHQFDDEDVASSLALPTPSLDLDFRLSIRVKPKLNVGAGASGRQSWISCVGGQWAGRWGKGVVLQGGQDVQTSVKDTATRIDAQYLLQTSEEHPALFICKITGWLTGEREVMERLQDPVAADNVAANRYQLRATMQLETGDERYQDVNTGVWVCSGCRRGAEIVYDAYRIS